MVPSKSIRKETWKMVSTVLVFHLPGRSPQSRISWLEKLNVACSRFTNKNWNGTELADSAGAGSPKFFWFSKYERQQTDVSNTSETLTLEPLHKNPKKIGACGLARHQQIAWWHIAMAQRSMSQRSGSAMVGCLELLNVLINTMAFLEEAFI